MNEEKVIFFADDHSYWWNEKKLRSVGSIIKQVTPPFNESYWLTHTVLKHKFGTEYQNHYRTFKKFAPPAKELFHPFISKMNASEFMELKTMFKEQWDFKRNLANYRGSSFHSLVETTSDQLKIITNPWSGVDYPLHVHEKEFDNESIFLDLSLLPDGAYSELLVFDLKWMIAGQADQVFIETVDGIRYIDINDHKTNEKKPSTSAPEWCYPPFEGEYASTHFKYTLQISSYALLLERHGFTPRNLAYTHYQNYDPTQSSFNNITYQGPKLNTLMLNLC